MFATPKAFPTAQVSPSGWKNLSPPSPGHMLPADPMPITGGKAHGWVRSMLLRKMDGFFIRIYTGYLSSHNHRVRAFGYGRKALAGFGPENLLSRIYFLMPLNPGYFYMDHLRMVPFFLIIKMRTGSS